MESIALITSFTTMSISIFVICKIIIKLYTDIVNINIERDGEILKCIENQTKVLNEIIYLLKK